MTDQELREIVAETARVVRDLGERTDRLVQSIDEMRASLTEESRKTDGEINKTNRLVQDLARQIGGLGNKFGGYTEGLAKSSVERMLRSKFHATDTDYSIFRVADVGDDQVEVDALGWNQKEVYVVEVKSYLQSEELKRTLRTMAKFPKLFPEHAGKKVFGVIVAVELAEGIEQAVAKKGIYLARADDHLFKLEIPPGFTPTVFGRNGKLNGSGKSKR